MKSILSAIVRHLLTTFGGGAVFSGTDVDAIVGALAVIIGIGWSIYEKRKASR